MASYKFIPRDGSILMYQNEGDIKYVASCQMVLMGTRAYIHTLNGRDFYRILVDLELAPFRDRGISSVHAMVSGEHFRAIRMALRHLATVTEKGTETLAGHALRWIQIDDLSPPKEITMENNPVPERRTNDAQDSQWRGLVETQLSQGQDRMTRIEQELKVNTKVTTEMNSNVGEMLEFFGNLKGFAKGVDLIGRIARPLGYIAAAVAAIISVYTAFKAGATLR